MKPNELHLPQFDAFAKRVQEGQIWPRVHFFAGLVSFESGGFKGVLYPTGILSVNYPGRGDKLYFVGKALFKVNWEYEAKKVDRQMPLPV